MPLAGIFLACLLSAIVTPVASQTFTACDPTKTTCPPNPALGIAKTWDLSNSSLDSDSWGMTAGEVEYGNGAGMFYINETGQSTTARSNFYIFFGSVSIMMKASKGQGVVSSVTLLSDDLDEIDSNADSWPAQWEFIGGNNTHVQTNYFGKGNNETYDRSLWIPVNDPQNEWHNYTTVWTADQLEWWVDGQVVRTLPQAKADGGGAQYPQSPTNVSIGIWPAGDSASNGTVEWAGGKVNYDEAPFLMSVASVYVNDGTKNASSYTYGDNTGSYKNIKVAAGKSAVTETLTQPPPETINQKFNKLSTGAKIAIFVSIGGFALALLGLCLVCCCRQRRLGRHERMLADAEWDKSNAELMAYRRQMTRGGFSKEAGPLSPNPQHAAQKFQFSYNGSDRCIL